MRNLEPTNSAPRFHIHPRTNIPNQFHSSPEFVWREWSIYSSKPVPLWMKYTSHPADIESCVIHVLETEVRKCDWYAANPENGDVACELHAWALAMVIPAVPDVDIEMPAINPIPSPPRQLSPAPPQPKFTAAGWPVRAKRKTWKLLQQLPAPAPPVVSDPSPDPEPAPAPQPATATWVWNTIRTTINGFGLYCEYPSVPSYNSDEVLKLEEMSDIPTGTQSNTATITANLTPFEPATPALLEGPAAEAEGSDIGPFLN
ncbi:hypothetical protein B0H14DRAFT_3513709 [Mycena olivaceomarginata]|nr:hypothetical protein B0H14DRAFT_3513709 [Mycena olivaceomarginata]